MCVSVCVAERESIVVYVFMISLHFLFVQFEQENRALYEEMNSMTEDVRSVLPLCLNQEVSVFLA